MHTLGDATTTNTGVVVLSYEPARGSAEWLGPQVMGRAQHGKREYEGAWWEHLTGKRSRCQKGHWEDRWRW